GHESDISLWFVVALGFANSMVWAGIWPLALNELGKFTKLGASVMIMGLCGNAFLPLIYGHFADVYNVRTAYLVLLPCYAYLIFYAMHGYRLRRWA
ncbi:MAG: glucose/galactose MFS transporter, partial [Ferruginibacter sp.]